MPTDAQHTKAHPKQKSLPSLIKPLLISSIALQAHTPSQLTPLPKNGRRRPRSQADWARLAQRTDPGAAHHRTRARRDPAPHCQCRRSFCEHFRCSAAASRARGPAARRALCLSAGREIDSEHATLYTPVSISRNLNTCTHTYIGRISSARWSTRHSQAGRESLHTAVQYALHSSPASRQRLFRPRILRSTLPCSCA